MMTSSIHENKFMTKENELLRVKWAHMVEKNTNDEYVLLLAINDEDPRNYMTRFDRAQNPKIGIHASIYADIAELIKSCYILNHDAKTVFLREAEKEERLLQTESFFENPMSADDFQIKTHEHIVNYRNRPYTVEWLTGVYRDVPFMMIHRVDGKHPKEDISRATYNHLIKRLVINHMNVKKGRSISYAVNIVHAHQKDIDAKHYLQSEITEFFFTQELG